MLTSILFRLSSSRLAGIDLGSQFIKIAEEAISGPPKMVLNADRGVSFPSAAAIKATKKLGAVLKDSDLEDITIKFGTPALKILKHHPEMGYQYLPFMLARFNSSYNTSKYFKPVEFLSYYLANLLDSIKESSDIGFVVPFYWTRLQRKALTDACEMYHIPLHSIIDDNTALAALYSANKLTRYQNSSKSVVFVDVGAMSVKVSGMVFTWMGNHSLVNETVSDWTEAAGGIKFAEAVAKAKNITLKKAQKFIQNSNSSVLLPILTNQLSEIKAAIKHVIDTTKTLASSVDEIQLIGGGSSLKFVKDIIKDVAGSIPVKKDFNADEALASGCVLTLMIAEEVSPYPPIFFIPRSQASITVTCKETQKICQKGYSCRDVVAETNSSGCNYIYIRADPRHIPAGTQSLIAKYKLVNISSMNITNNGRGEMEFSRVYPNLKRVIWCNGEDCKPIKFESVSPYEDGEEIQTDSKILERFDEIMNDRRVRARMIPEINELIENLAPLAINPEEAKRQGLNEMSAEMKDLLAKHTLEYKDKAFDQMKKNELTKVREDLEKVLRSVLPKPTPKAAPSVNADENL